MKKYRLLLHIGLPKTATTSFQNNVLHELHKQEKINFLGRFSDLDKKHDIAISKIIKRISKKVMCKAEMEKLKKDAKKPLTSRKLNVLSEESLGTSLHLTRRLEDVLFRLSEVFSSCDIKLLVSLRSPVDIIFSRYVENYAMYKYSHLGKRLDTFENFSKYLLENNNSEMLFEFLYENHLHLIDKYFNDKTVLLFEDLKHDEDSYFLSLSNSLGIDKNKIKDLFLVKHQNVKVNTGAGKQNENITLDQFLRVRIIPLLNSVLIGKKHLRSTCRFFMKLAKKITIGRARNHVFPNKRLSSELFEAFAIKDIDKFSREHALDKNKLIAYGYGTENSP